jgi:hypothetical protein
MDNEYWHIKKRGGMNIAFSQLSEALSNRYSDDVPVGNMADSQDFKAGEDVECPHTVPDADRCSMAFL